MLHNPIFIGAATAAVIYFYRIYHRSQLPEAERTEVGLALPVIAGCAMAVIVHLATNDAPRHGSIAAPVHADIDAQSDFESELADIGKIDKIDVRPGHNTANMDVYEDPWL